MLRMVLNVSWKDKVINEVLYGDLPNLYFNISKGRLQLAGHYIRHSELVASGLVLCEPTQEEASRGEQALRPLDAGGTLVLIPWQLPRLCMADREVWRAIMVRGDST